MWKRVASVYYADHIGAAATLDMLPQLCALARETPDLGPTKLFQEAVKLTEHTGGARRGPSPMAGGQRSHAGMGAPAAGMNCWKCGHPGHAAPRCSAVVDITGQAIVPGAPYRFRPRSAMAGGPPRPPVPPRATHAPMYHHEAASPAGAPPMLMPPPQA